MKSGRRGRRGGRRQRRREAEAKAQAEAQGVSRPAAEGPASPEPAPADALADAHPRPMSARELVARLEAQRTEALHPPGADAPGHAGEVLSPADAAHAAANGAAHAPDGSGAAASAPRATVPPPEPRRFTVAGQEWLAEVAGRGTGGTGRVAQARLAAIRFSTAADPERVAAEVLVSGAKLDALYDDELAELLERGLRSRKGNG